jgi:hypothetical protein
MAQQTLVTSVNEPGYGERLMPLDHAGGHGDLWAAQWLIANKPDVARSPMVLHSAAKEGHLEFVKFLVRECDIDVNVRNTD